MGEEMFLIRDTITRASYCFMTVTTLNSHNVFKICELNQAWLLNGFLIWIAPIAPPKLRVGGIAPESSYE